MVKKFLIILVVIAAGVMLGVIFSASLPGKNNTLPSFSSKPDQKPQPSPINQQTTDKVKNENEGFKIQLNAAPQTIKPAGDLDPAKQLDKIEKSILIIKYTNNTQSDLTKISLRFIPKGNVKYGFGALPEGGASPNEKAQSEDKKGIVFDTQDVKKGQTKEAKVFVFGRNAGILNLTVEARAKEFSSRTSTAVTINVK